jgi:hypothetical protein
MRRIEIDDGFPRLSRADYDEGCRRLASVGYPAELSYDAAWESFRELREAYAPIACQLTFWTMAAPAPWSGSRNGFPGIVDYPDAPTTWTIVDREVEQEADGETPIPAGSGGGGR